METINTEFQIEQKESIKLSKNSKGYNWDIRIFPPTDENQVQNDEKMLKRLEYLNKEMKRRFESQEKVNQTPDNDFDDKFKEYEIKQHHEDEAMAGIL